MRNPPPGRTGGAICEVVASGGGLGFAILGVRSATRNWRETLPHPVVNRPPMSPSRPRSRRTAAPCLHCARQAATTPRGLCRPCYLAPHVRALYPPARAARDPGLAAAAPLPAEPTTALPGTPAK